MHSPAQHTACPGVIPQLAESSACCDTHCKRFTASALKCFLRGKMFYNEILREEAARSNYYMSGI